MLHRSLCTLSLSLSLYGFAGDYIPQTKPRKIITFAFVFGQLVGGSMSFGLSVCVLPFPEFRAKLLCALHANLLLLIYCKLPFLLDVYGSLPFKTHLETFLLKHHGPILRLPIFLMSLSFARMHAPRNGRQKCQWIHDRSSGKSAIK